LISGSAQAAGFAANHFARLGEGLAADNTSPRDLHFLEPAAFRESTNTDVSKAAGESDGREMGHRESIPLDPADAIQELHRLQHNAEPKSIFSGCA